MEDRDSAVSLQALSVAVAVVAKEVLILKHCHCLVSQYEIGPIFELVNEFFCYCARRPRPAED